MNKHLPHSVYLIHGWAANGHVFADLCPLLPTNWQVRAPDLPGHGAGQLNGAFDIMAAADTLAAEMPDNSDIVGWSLGGLVALYIAIRHPHKVRRLCLTSSFAKFLATTDYPQGLNRSALDKMIGLFEQDYPKYMRQFLQLQLLNTPDGEEIIASVLPDMVKNGAPAALKAALDALSLADARPFLRQIRQPVLLVYGGKDSITPPRMGEYLEQHLPFAELQIIEKAAHAPFLSHAAEFSGLLKRFFG